MKTVTDEYLEQNREQVEAWYEEYSGYVESAKTAAIKSIKFYVIGFGSFLLFAWLYTLLEWKLLANLCVLIMLITLCGGIIIGFYFKGVKPVFKMYKYYWSSILSVANKINILGNLPFIGWIITLFVLSFDLWVVCFSIACWMMCPPLLYFLAHCFFKKATKGYKQGIEWHDRRKANNYESSVDEVEERR